MIHPLFELFCLIGLPIELPIVLPIVLAIGLNIGFHVLQVELFI